MDSLPRDTILEMHPDTLKVVRKEINLHRPGEIKEALKILKEWLQTQQHFKKKDFADHYLESTLISAKGSIERAKKLIDGMCTLRTLLPKFFSTFDVRRDTYEFSKITYPIMLPKLTRDHHRVYIAKAKGNFSTAEQYLQFYKYCALMGEYAKINDYVANIQIVLDLVESNILKIVSIIDLVDLRQGLTILMDGFGLRIKGIHIITESKTIEAFLAILKQVLKPKIVSRLHTYSSSEAVCNIIGKDVLPVDLGGTERSLETLHGANEQSCYEQIRGLFTNLSEELSLGNDMNITNQNPAARLKTNQNRTFPNGNVFNGFVNSLAGIDEKCFSKCREEWLNILSSEDFTKYIQDLYKGGTDESLRTCTKFNEDYSGMPGTFRVLTLD